ncbi:DEKNAAC105348 [Brettanomyces naardenensis]|uniref:DEKNAAC105348 n=1 Tax=Brettanomyces naardenensis TaxID=13370 RepID=A0A448YTK4_BRENA|nr:DEKNAAC105348 [Brettanomyces naardenensis]
MIIPQFIRENAFLFDSNALCPAAVASDFTSILLKRNDLQNAQNKWDQCMDKKWCKIVAIVCICIGGLIVLWLISMICSMICCGANCARSICWCCQCDSCCSGRRNRAPPPPPPPPRDSRGDAYNNPNMYYHPQNEYNKQQQQYYYA